MATKPELVEKFKKLREELSAEEWERRIAQYNDDRKRVALILWGFAIPHLFFEVYMGEMTPIMPVAANYYISRFVVRSKLDAEMRIDNLVRYCLKIYSLVLLVRIILGLIVFTILMA